MNVFIDTSAWLALFNADDQFHSHAKATWKKLSKEKREVYTSDWIFTETIALLHRRYNWDAASQAGHQILINEQLKMIFLDSPLLVHTWQRFLDPKARNVSLVDCSSFTIMTQLKIQSAFAFDEDFTKEGFVLL